MIKQLFLQLLHPLRVAEILCLASQTAVNRVSVLLQYFKKWIDS